MDLDAWLSEREGGGSVSVLSSSSDGGEAQTLSSPPPPPVPGVYAIFDSESRLQHVGYARDAVRAVRAAREAVGGTRASSIRAKLFAPGRGKMVGRAELSSLANSWLSDSDSSSPPPPGNTSAEAALWAGGGGGVAAVSGSSELPSSSSASSSLSSSSDAEDPSLVVVAPATAARGMTPAQAALHADRKDKLEKAMGVKKKEEELKAEAAREERAARLAGGAAAVGDDDDGLHVVSRPHIVLFHTFVGEIFAGYFAVVLGESYTISGRAVNFRVKLDLFVCRRVSDVYFVTIDSLFL